MNMSDNSFKSKSKFQWDDVVPVKQYDGKPAVLNLKYTPDYEELMDYFRAILHSGEISERAHEIAGFTLKIICSNYNAWYLRKLCLENLPDKLSYEDEIEFVTDLKTDNEKVFQIWDHRKYLIDKINDPSGEIDFLEDVLESDNKNYHAWSYRIWLCTKFNLYQEEWSILKKYFIEDLKNNSAWNYRFFLFQSFFYKKEEQNIASELEFTFEQIKQDSQNESSWNYLMGFFKNYEFNDLKEEFQGQEKSQLNVFSKPVASHLYLNFPQVEEFVKEQYKKDPNNRLLLNVLIEINLQHAQSFLQEESQQNDDQKLKVTKEKIQQVINTCELLANQIDPIRTNYWNWFAQNIKKDFQKILQ